MLNDAAIRQFDQSLEQDLPELTARCQALFARDPEALQSMIRHATRCGDLKTIIAACRVLEPTNALGREAALALAQALLAEGRWSEALEAFGHRKLEGLDSPKYFLGVAEALAALDRRDEALQATGKALAIKPDYAGALTLRLSLLGETVEGARTANPAPLAAAARILASDDLPTTISQLGRLADLHKHDADVRGALARCVGAEVLGQVRPKFLSGSTGKIINLVLFSNEFTLLRMRLEEMAGWVDKFVVVEAAQTFTGLPKPLHFQANREQFADFDDKIVHLSLAEFPGHLTSPWAREFYQRDMAIAAASGLCGEEDFILETDADEIIDGRALVGFEGDYAGLQTLVSRFFLNYRPDADNKKRLRRTSSVFKAKHLTRFGVSFARFVLARRWPRAYRISNAGWHFTSVGDAAGISRKINSYAHQEQTKAQFRGADHFQDLLDKIRGGEAEPGWEVCALDETFPAYVRDHRDELADLIL